EVVQVGAPVALIDTAVSTGTPMFQTKTDAIPTVATTLPIPNPTPANGIPLDERISLGDRFYSPLVLNIAREEKISFHELNSIPGTGKDGRVTKNDILFYVEKRKTAPVNALTDALVAEKAPEIPISKVEFTEPPIVEKPLTAPVSAPAASYSGSADIIEMDRMRKMISERMLESKRTSAHVTSFVEADVTNIVFWRNKMKGEYKEKENTALTLTPIFIEALAKALKDFPMVNASVEGNSIIVKKDINIGMAVALPDGNLIVPVIRNVDQMNLIGITKKVNDLAKRARSNELKPDEVSGGTYSMSNMGSFGNLMGTPIIVQPQVAIMAFGAVIKKPAVVETLQGDHIAIRHMMFLSHTYDHRIIDGALGGMFVRKVADYLEGFDTNRKS
ncbi:MAG: 2-oxo acid dehydrogenase subunit E2, partial [Cytophagales bacterium]|nr:2-oxo acid dehydrogenase subunit E2 [Cytophagales bacterium]